jgi:hypothetical protein
MNSRISFFDELDSSALIAIGAHHFDEFKDYTSDNMVYQFYFHGFGNPGFTTIFKSEDESKSILLRIEAKAKIDFLKEVYSVDELIPLMMKWVEGSFSN